jgi:hypothetical protein
MQSQMRCCVGGCFALTIISIALGGLLPASAEEPREAPEATIRAALEKWTAVCNAGNAGGVCGLWRMLSRSTAASAGQATPVVG